MVGVVIHRRVPRIVCPLAGLDSPPTCTCQGDDVFAASAVLPNDGGPLCPFTHAAQRTQRPAREPKLLTPPPRRSTCPPSRPTSDLPAETPACRPARPAAAPVDLPGSPPHRLTCPPAPAGNVSQPGASTNGHGLDEQRKFFTDNPDTILEENSDKIEERLDALKKEHLAQDGAAGSKKKTKKKKNKPDGGALLRETGVWLENLTGHHDFSFFQKLPDAGTKVVLIRCLCNLHGKSLADGCDTLTGAFVEAFGRVLGVHLILSNIAMVCHRKGKDGVEPTGGQAGCVDPTGERLKVLAMVKELHYIGLLAAGLDVVAVIASSNASISSFGITFGKHFESQEGTGMYQGLPIFTTPHPKYISPRCRFTSGVARALGVSLGDPLAVTSGVLDGWACIAVSIVWLVEGEPFEDFEDFEEGVEYMYEALRNDPKSRAMAREWHLRYTTTTSPETQEKLTAALGEHFRAMHAAVRLAKKEDPLQRSK